LSRYDVAMGKPYLKELDRLAGTTDEVFGFNIDVLKRALEGASGHGLAIVASGGSLTAAQFLADYHHRAVGHPCRAMSPLTFQSDPAFGRGHVWLLSAGGRNHDILAAADHAMASGAKSITAVIATAATPLEARLSAYGASSCFTFALSAGPDGFLATSSLWATCLLIERAMTAAFTVLGATHNDVHAALAWARKTAPRLPVHPGTLVGIADPLTMVGASDLEMRATEAALKNVWVADLRNLAHGRHFWFAAQRESSAALILATRAYRELATTTADLLATITPVHLVDVPGPSPGLAAIAYSIFATAELAAGTGRDPGRPGVPEFGEALYSLQSESPPVDAMSVVDSIVHAKLGRRSAPLSESDRQAWTPRLNEFVHGLAKADIPAVVFDFDGTLIESSRRYEALEPRVVEALQRLLNGGIAVGIATGRGESCADSLRAALPQRMWPGVTIGYYNGSIIQSLAQRELATLPSDPSIVQAAERLKEHLPTGRTQFRRYPKQCSVTLLDGTSLAETWCLVASILHDFVEAKVLKIWMSSHSIDVVVASVTKQDVVGAVASRAGCLPEQVLCVGDRGRWPGNDSELLDSTWSLSADECSWKTDRCWNLAGSPHQQVAATCRLLGLFDVVDQRLVFHGLLR